MEIDDDIQTQGGFKFPSIRGGGVEITDGDSTSNKKMASRFGDWPSSSSRIVRVSRTSGGKDRHSKVLTSRGPRDRRIRLSVATAIQFYDLQDRLGYDQPSKAVEWLLQAASTSIDELPSINSPFPETPKQISDGKRSSPEPDPDPELEEEEPIFHQQQQQQHVSISKSTTCSSTNSETSKGSGLSLSRCATRVRARERARGRTGEKDKGKEHRSLISDTSFTELLSSGMDKYHNSPQESNLLKKPTRQGQGQGQWSTSPMDCFATGFSGSSSSSSSVGFSSQIHMANSNNNNTTFPISMSVSPFNVDHQHHHHHLQEQHFSLLPDISPSTGVGGEYNLNFKISPASFSGYSRGTLQSNSQSLSTMPPHLQRFSHIDGSNLPLFIGTASSTSAPGHDNSHHLFPPALEARSRLHLGYGDGFLHSDHKGKGKN